MPAMRSTFLAVVLLLGISVAATSESSPKDHQKISKRIDNGSPITVVPSTSDGSLMLVPDTHTGEAWTIGYLTDQHSLIKTTDADGNVGYVTRPGDWAKTTQTQQLPASAIKSRVLVETHAVEVVRTRFTPPPAATVFKVAPSPQYVVVPYDAWSRFDVPYVTSQDIDRSGMTQYIVHTVTSTSTSTHPDIERCMTRFLEPLVIATAVPVMYPQDSGNYGVDWWFHSTTLSTPHWGKTVHDGLYRPATMAYPSDSSKLLNMGGQREANATCYDADSCHAFCVDYANSKSWLSDPFHIGLMIIPLLAFAAAFLCCCGTCLKFCGTSSRRQRTKERVERQWARIDGAEKMKKAGYPRPTTAVVEQTQNPSEAVMVAGPAAGAAAATAVAGSENEQDGRGTTGRRVEEGRGRVNFADGGVPGGDEKSSAVVSGKEGAVVAAPAGEATQTQTVVKPAEQASTTTVVRPAEHTEPVAVHDGAMDGTVDNATGSDYNNTANNSVRGRKRGRNEGGTGGLMHVW